MNESKALIQEYNNLWNEKLIHKQNIRKFHNYLTYLTAIGSLALTFYGVSTQDFIKASVDISTANNMANNLPKIVNLFLLSLTPILIMTLTFPINDLFHIYAIGNQIGQIECKINDILNNNKVLLWEHSVCPAVYGGEKVFKSDEPITNVISFGDYLLLLPVLYLICVFSIYLSINYLCQMKHYYILPNLYAGLIIYMMGSIIFLGVKIKKYTGPNSLLNKVIHHKNYASESKISTEKTESKESNDNDKKKHNVKKKRWGNK